VGSVPEAAEGDIDLGPEGLPAFQQSIYLPA
jgi:hypothetical protein